MINIFLDGVMLTQFDSGPVHFVMVPHGELEDVYLLLFPSKKFMSPVPIDKNSVVEMRYQPK